MGSERVARTPKSKKDPQLEKLLKLFCKITGLELTLADLREPTTAVADSFAVDVGLCNDGVPPFLESDFGVPEEEAVRQHFRNYLDDIDNLQSSLPSTKAQRATIRSVHCCAMQLCGLLGVTWIEAVEQLQAQRFKLSDDVCLQAFLRRIRMPPYAPHILVEPFLAETALERLQFDDRNVEHVVVRPILQCLFVLARMYHAGQRSLLETKMLRERGGPPVQDPEINSLIKGLLTVRKGTYRHPCSGEVLFPGSGDNTRYPCIFGPHMNSWARLPEDLGDGVPDEGPRGDLLVNRFIEFRRHCKHNIQAFLTHKDVATLLVAARIVRWDGEEPLGNLVAQTEAKVVTPAWKQISGQTKKRKRKKPQKKKKSASR